MLATGDLRQRVTVQRRIDTSDGHDGFTETWTTVNPARRSAQVLPLEGRDLERARQVDPRISHQVTLRYWRAYQTDLAGGRTRVIYHDVTDRTFEIVSPPLDVEENHVWVQMQARELA